MWLSYCLVEVKSSNSCGDPKNEASSCDIRDENDNLYFEISNERTDSKSPYYEIFCEGQFNDFNFSRYKIHQDWLPSESDSEFEAEFCDLSDLSYLIGDGGVLKGLRKSKKVTLKGSKSAIITLEGFPNKISEIFPLVEEIILKHFRLPGIESRKPIWPVNLKNMSVTMKNTTYFPVLPSNKINDLTIDNCDKKFNITNVAKIETLNILTLKNCPIERIPFNELNKLSNFETLIVNGSFPMLPENSTLDINNLEINDISYFEETREDDIPHIFDFTKYPKISRFMLKLLSPLSFNDPFVRRLFEEDIKWPNNTKIDLTEVINEKVLNTPIFHRNCWKWERFQYLTTNETMRRLMGQRCKETLHKQFINNLIIIIGVIVGMLLAMTLAFFWWFWKKRSWFYTLELFRNCPRFHTFLLSRNNDTDAANAHDAVLLFHRSPWCLCNNIEEDTFSEGVAITVKEILEKGDPEFVRWTYDNGIHTMFDAGIPGKPTSWNLQNLFKKSKRCIVILSKLYVKYHHQEMEEIKKNYDSRSSRKKYVPNCRHDRRINTFNFQHTHFVPALFS